MVLWGWGGGEKVNLIFEEWRKEGGYGDSRFNKNGRSEELVSSLIFQLYTQLVVAARNDQLTLALCARALENTSFGRYKF